MFVDNRRLGWSLAAVGMLLVSTDSLFVRLAGIDAWTVAFLVAVFSAPIQLVGWWVFERDPMARSIREGLSPLLLVGVSAAVSQLAFIGAITKTDVANVVAIVGAAPILTAVAGFVILNERPTSTVVSAIVVTMIGMAVVVAGSLGAPKLFGDLLALVAIVAFAGSLIAWRHYNHISRFVGLAISAALMALMAAPFVQWATIDQRALTASAAMGLVFNPMGRLAHSSAPRYAPAAEVSLFTPTETIAAPIWAWLFFSEIPSLNTLIGGSVVLLGVFWGILGTSR